MNTRMQVINAIRAARGLDYRDKVFLMIVESRGEMYVTVEKAIADMGMSRNTFYRTRDSLLAKGVLEGRRHASGTSAYTVNEARLRAFLPEPVPQ